MGKQKRAPRPVESDEDNNLSVSQAVVLLVSLGFIPFDSCNIKSVDTNVSQEEPIAMSEIMEWTWRLTHCLRLIYRIHSGSGLLSEIVDWKYSYGRVLAAELPLSIQMSTSQCFLLELSWLDKFLLLQEFKVFTCFRSYGCQYSGHLGTSDDDFYQTIHHQQHIFQPSVCKTSL